MDPLLWLFHQSPRADWQWNFDASQPAWRAGNALALANCALLAYSDEAVIQQRLLSRGFTRVTVCESDHHAADTFAFVAERPDAIVIALRGTRPTSAVDFAIDFDARQVPFEASFGFLGWGAIHEGWARGLHAVLKPLLAAPGLAQGGTRIWITGHSLGGALAITLAALLANVAHGRLGGVYSFGQPRVGDADFCRRYDERLGALTHRCVNDRDPVPHLPPRAMTLVERVVAGPALKSLAELVEALAGEPEPSVDHYGHVGRLRLLLPQGGLSEEAADEAAREPPIVQGSPSVRSLFFELPELLVSSPLLLKDHAPINAVTHDGYVERLERLAP